LEEEPSLFDENSNSFESDSKNICNISTNQEENSSQDNNKEEITYPNKLKTSSKKERVKHSANSAKRQKNSSNL